MKKYVRTKDGKITTFDVNYEDNEKFFEYLNQFENFKDKIAKIADTIEELIEIGDLVKSCANEICEVIMIVDNGVKVNGGYLFFEDIIELYTKQGNDYILIARKENGEWRVI